MLHISWMLKSAKCYADTSRTELSMHLERKKLCAILQIFACTAILMFRYYVAPGNCAAISLPMTPCTSRWPRLWTRFS